MAAQPGVYEYGTLHVDGNETMFSAAELDISNDTDGNERTVQVLFSPSGFVLPSITHRPYTLEEVVALRACLTAAIDRVTR